MTDVLGDRRCPQPQPPKETSRPTSRLGVMDSHKTERHSSGSVYTRPSEDNHQPACVYKHLDLSGCYELHGGENYIER